jgi:hypothetical protein
VAAKGIQLAEYISDTLRPLVRKDLGEMASKMSAKQPTPKAKVAQK